MYNALNNIDQDIQGVTKGDLQEGFKFQQFFIKQGLDPLTREIRAELMVLADQDLATMRGWDAETVANAKAAEQRLGTAEHRNLMHEAFKKIFRECDVDKDKRLNKAEYLDFCAKMKAFQKDENVPSVHQSKEYQVAMWTAVNKIHGDYEGLSKNDIGMSRTFMQGYMMDQRRKGK